MLFRFQSSEGFSSQSLKKSLHCFILFLKFVVLVFNKLDPLIETLYSGFFSLMFGILHLDVENVLE